MTLWQIAAGAPGRDYRKLFFDHDVMLLGPSDRGDASDGRYRDRLGTSGYGQIHRFTTSSQPGDRIIARLGKEVSVSARYHPHPMATTPSMGSSARSTAGTCAIRGE
jgi:hypothetical protein